MFDIAQKDHCYVSQSTPFRYLDFSNLDLTLVCCVKILGEFAHIYIYIYPPPCMGMQSTLVDLSVSGHSSMCLSELKKQGPTTTVHTQPGFRCFSDVDRIDWSECRCLIGACRDAGWA